MSVICQKVVNLLQFFLSSVSVSDRVVLDGFEISSSFRHEAKENVWSLHFLNASSDNVVFLVTFTVKNKFYTKQTELYSNNVHGYRAGMRLAWPPCTDVLN